MLDKVTWIAEHLITKNTKINSSRRLKNNVKYAGVNIGYRNLDAGWAVIPIIGDLNNKTSSPVTGSGSEVMIGYTKEDYILFGDRK